MSRTNRLIYGLLHGDGIVADARCARDGDPGFRNCERQFLRDFKMLNPCPLVHSFTKCVSSEITSCDEETRNMAQLLLNGLASLYNCTARVTNGTGAEPKCDSQAIRRCNNIFRDPRFCPAVESYATCLSSEISTCNETRKKILQRRLDDLNQTYNCSARYGIPTTPIPSTSQLPGNTKTPIPSTSQLPGNTKTPIPSTSQLPRNTTTPTSASPSLTGAFRDKNAGVYIYNTCILYAIYYMYTYFDRRCHNFEIGT